MGFAFPATATLLTLSGRVPLKSGLPLVAISGILLLAVLVPGIGTVVPKGDQYAWVPERFSWGS